MHKHSSNTFLIYLLYTFILFLEYSRPSVLLFCSASGVTASFGEMLLLMAIHFHSNQLSAIFELVSSTLGMKVPIRHNNMTRMKQIFTQEIFTEQVIYLSNAFSVIRIRYLNIYWYNNILKISIREVALLNF